LPATQPKAIKARIYTKDGQEYLQAPGDFDYPLTDDLWSVPALVEALDRRNLAGAALSVAPPTLCYWADPGLAADVSAANNDSIADVVARTTRPLRRPLHSPASGRRPRNPRARARDEAARDARRHDRQPPRRAEPGPPRDGSIPRGLPGLDAVVFVHPYDVLGSERMQSYYMWNLIGMVTERRSRSSRSSSAASTSVCRGSRPTSRTRR